MPYSTATLFIAAPSRKFVIWTASHPNVVPIRGNSGFTSSGSEASLCAYYWRWMDAQSVGVFSRRGPSAGS